MTIEDVQVIISGSNDRGQGYQDSVLLDSTQWNTALQLIRDRITELEQRPGHRAGLRSMAEYDRLVDLITTIDI
jgi:hypothetical protein